MTQRLARSLAIAALTWLLAPRVAIAQSADLAVVLGDNTSNTLLVAPAGFVSAATVSISGWTVTNRGTQATAAGWRYGIFLSADPIIDARDVLVREVPVAAALAPGATFSPPSPLTVVIPVIAAGPMYLGVLVDSRNNTAESNEANNSAAAPVVLLPGPPDNTPVIRIQLRLTTGTVASAGTDNAVLVELNGANRTFLDYPRNDFESGDVFTYDLLQNGVTTLGNIQQLRISKARGDGWCLRQADLLVNGFPIYSRTFGSTCRWLDDASGGSLEVRFDYTQLRQSTTWQGYVAPPLTLPITLSRTEMESRIAAAVGHAISGTPAYWGFLHGRGVEVGRKSATQLSVDLDLALEVPGPNSEADIDFDLGITCSCGTISMNVANVRASVSRSWFYDLFTNTGIENSIERPLRGISQVVATGQNQVFCPTIAIDNGGNISLGFPTLGPDLISAPGGVSDMTRPGDVLQTRVTVRNVGNLAAGAFGTGLYFGPSPMPSAATQLDNTNTASLPACQTRTWTRAVTIPANTSCGPYYLTTSADVAQGVAEANEGNNAFPFRMTVGLPDLAIVSNIELFTMNFFGMPGGVPGSPFTVGVGLLRNEGVYASVPVSVGVYLSTDRTLDNADIRLGGDTIPSLDPRENYSWGPTQLVIPPNMAAGRYTLGILIDDTATMRECDKANNVRWFDFVVSP